MNQKELDRIITCMRNGNLKDARDHAMWRWKYNPTRMAYRVGKVVSALCDPDGSYHDPDMAKRFIDLFKD